MTTGADALYKRALRNELHFQLAGDHLLLRFSVEANVAHDRFAYELCADELAHAAAGCPGIVGDHGEIALILAHDLVDDPLRRADGHESPDHQARAVRYHGDRLLERNGLHIVSPSQQGLLRGPAAVHGQSHAANLS